MSRKKTPALPVLPVQAEGALTPETAKAMRLADEKATRDRELSQARLIYTMAICGRSVDKDHPGKAGSDLVGRVLRSRVVSENGKSRFVNTNSFVTIEEVSKALRAVDPATILATMEAHISVLVQNKSNGARLQLFRAFVNANGLKLLADAFETFAKYRAWQYSEEVSIPGTSSHPLARSIRFAVDVRAEVTNIFGLKLTSTRRAKYGKLVSE